MLVEPNRNPIMIPREIRHDAPLLPGSSVWLYRPKTWKFGRKSVGPYEVLSRQGVNYKIR